MRCNARVAFCTGERPAFGHLCSNTMTQLRASSRPIACLTFAGISIPIVSPPGGVGVSGGSGLPTQTPDCLLRSDHSFTTCLYSDKGKFYNDHNAARNENMSE
jgi:hypothetical protein